MRLDGAVVVVDEAHNLVATLPTPPKPHITQKRAVPRQPSACSASCCLPVLGKTLSD